MKFETWVRTPYGRLYTFRISNFTGILRMFSQNTPQNTEHSLYTFCISYEFRVLLMRQKNKPQNRSTSGAKYPTIHLSYFSFHECFRKTHYKIHLYAVERETNSRQHGPFLVLQYFPFYSTMRTDLNLRQMGDKRAGWVLSLTLKTSFHQNLIFCLFSPVQCRWRSTRWSILIWTYIYMSR